MRKFLFAIIFISLFNIAELQSAQSSDSGKKAAKQELQELRNKIKSLQSVLSKKRSAQSIAVKKLRKTEKKIATASKILRSTIQQLKRKKTELKRLNRLQKSLKADEKIQKQALANQLRSAYMNGKQEYLKLLLNQQDPDKLGRMLVYYDYMNKARSKQVKKLQKTLTEMRTIDQKITKEIDKLNLLQKSKQVETRQLKKLKNNRKKIVDSLGKEIKLKNNELTDLEINAKELQILIDSVRKTIETMDFSQPLEGLKHLKGKLKWPVKGKHVKKYGSINQGQRSSGILISGKEGREISTIYHGRIVYADWLKGFGLLVIIDHGKGYMSLYGYNQALYKDVGDWTENREAIATLGQSGGQRSPALYFELRYQGKPVNPNKWFR